MQRKVFYYFSQNRLRAIDLSEGLLQAEYAVRGQIPIFAEKIKEGFYLVLN